MAYTDFVLGGVASVGATFFTNPLEVIKTRMQLQGEHASSSHVKPYKSILDAFATIARHDGILALQKGLCPALCFQFIINTFRLGIYKTAQLKGYDTNSKGQVSFSKTLFWGAIGGIVGSLISSPFFLVKTQLQSQAVSKIAVGYQHKHTGMLNALSDIYLKNGIFGLWRGALSTIPRAGLGSGTQIATFGTCKEYLFKQGLIESPGLLSFTSGMIAGSVMSLAITPPDVITTRLYNQGVDANGKGLYYKGLIDCCVKILRHEGVSGLYKGFWPNYLRIGPHSTLVLWFYDEMIRTRDKYFS